MRRKNQSSAFIQRNLSVALYRLMKQKDYHDINVTDICQKAGYGRTTYYRYFGNNKDDLILYLCRSEWEQEKAAHPEEAKKDEGKLLLESIYAHKEFFLALSKQNLDGLLFKMFYLIFGRQEMENEILSYGKSFFAGGYFGVTYHWIKTGCHDTPEEIQKKFMDGILYAFQKQKEEQEKQSTNS